MSTPTAIELLAKAKLQAKQAGTELEEREYSHYKSSRPAVRLITDLGIRIKFVNFELLTDDPDVIEYLDAQIARNGVPGISKSKDTVTLSDRDPMVKLEKDMRAKLELEYEQRLVDAAKGVTRNMGSTEGAVKINALSAKGTAT